MVSQSDLNQMQHMADVAKSNAETARLREENANHKAEMASMSLRSAKRSSQEFLGAAVGLFQRNKANTERSKELLFHIAIRETKFRATIEQIRKAFPGQAAIIDQCIEKVDDLYDGDRAEQFRKGKRIATNRLYDQIEEGGSLEQALDILKRKVPTKESS